MFKNYSISHGLGRLSGVSTAVQHAVIPAGDSGIYRTVAVIKQKIREGLSQPIVRQLVTQILAVLPRQATQADKSRAIVKWFMAHIKYRHDDDMSWTEQGLRWININQCPRIYRQCEPVEIVADAPQILKQGYGDCLSGDTLLLTPRGFKAIADIREGDYVMGDGDWTRVTKWWEKGTLPTLKIKLSSGSTVTATPDHKMFLENGVEIKAGQLEVDDRLLAPTSLREGDESFDPDMAWLMGVYVADGWWESSRVMISGKDGHPKEKQKKRIAEICDRRGWNYRWHEKYIAINEKLLVDLFAVCGKRAHEKQLPTLNWNKSTASHLLSGLAADGSISNSGTLTYNTTSPTLALQIRILHRMLGEKTNIHRVDNHGGLGTHPIYRIGVVRNERKDGNKPSLSVKVREIEDGEDIPVFDIETESHRFYLPEHDIVVHNCDDFVVLLSTMHQIAGIQTCPVIVAVDPQNPTEFTHVYLVANLDGTWTPIDAVNSAQPWGWAVENPLRREVVC